MPQAPATPRPMFVLELPAVLDLKAAAPLAGEFITRRGAELSVDASRVERLGAQCLQVLISAAMTWKSDELPLSIVDASPAFIEGLRRLGLGLADFIDQDSPQ